MLKGKLSDFDIISIFEMLNQQNKSGVLLIKPSNGSEINIYFNKGNIIDLSFKDFNKSLELFLVKKQIITKKMLKKLMAKARKEIKSIITLLIQDLYITNDLADLITDVYYDDAFRYILSIKKGEFSFNPDFKKSQKNYRTVFYVDQILLEYVRQRDELKMIKTKMPITDSKISKTGLNVNTLSQDEFSLYELMKDEEDLEKFRNRILIKYFDYINILYSMASKGVIVVSNYIDNDEKEKLLSAYKDEDKINSVNNKLDFLMLWIAVIVFLLSFSFFTVSVIKRSHNLKNFIKDIKVKPYEDDFFNYNYSNIKK